MAEIALPAAKPLKKKGELDWFLEQLEVMASDKTLR